MEKRQFYKDDSFFNNLYENYYLSLINYTSLITCDDDAAEDIVQEIFISLVDKEFTFISDSALKNFLFKSARNGALDYLKHKEVEEHYVSLYKNQLDADWEEKMDDEVLNLLFEMIDKLPTRCREIFLLHLDGLSNEEIAHKLNLSIETIKTQKKKAMRLLREQFNTNHKGYIYIISFFLHIAYPFLSV